MSAKVEDNGGLRRSGSIPREELLAAARWKPLGRRTTDFRYLKWRNPHLYISCMDTAYGLRESSPPLCQLKIGGTFVPRKKKGYRTNPLVNGWRWGSLSDFWFTDLHMTSQDPSDFHEKIGTKHHDSWCLRTKYLKYTCHADICLWLKKLSLISVFSTHLLKCCRGEKCFPKACGEQFERIKQQHFV